MKHNVISSDEDNLRDTIEQLVWAGYDPENEISSAAIEMVEFEGDIKLANQMVADAIGHLKKEQQKWPPITDYDRLHGAFSDLEALGIVARENFSCCGNCGVHEIVEEMEDEIEEGKKVIGYTFFHQQDTERAIGNNGLFLSYGPAPEGQNSPLEIGMMVAQALSARGLNVKWGGSVKFRIEVVMDWKRRWAE